MTDFLNSSFLELVALALVLACLLNVLCLAASLVYAAACLLVWTVRRLAGFKSADQIRDEWVDQMAKGDLT